MGGMPSPNVFGTQVTIPPANAGASISGATPVTMQLSMAASASVSPKENTLLGTHQKFLIVRGAEGAATAVSVMRPMMDSSDTHMRSLSAVATPLNYMKQNFSPMTDGPAMMGSGAPPAYLTASASMSRSPSSLSLSLGGSGFVNVGAAPMTAYQGSSVSGVLQSFSSATMSEDTLSSFPFFSATSSIVPQRFSSAVPRSSTTSSFTPTSGILVQASASAPPVNLSPPPQYNTIVNSSAGGSVIFHQDSCNEGSAARPIFGSHPTPVVRKGDAGRGYEAGVYYEGRVKRFNPIRGYGFVSATAKLIPVQSCRPMKEAGFISTSEKQSNAWEAKSLKTSDDGDNEGNTGKDASLVAVRGGVDAAAEPHAQISGDDIVYVKGAPYARHAVSMGDIFVHYNCLQRWLRKASTEANGDLVNLRAGSRVQFKVEMFVPAELLKMSDNKEAAAMLNSLGIPVEGNPDLLSGAIATKRGWGYQAIEVQVLPPKGILLTQVGPLSSATAAKDVAEDSVSSASLGSFVS
ncbi:hypothetical protein Q4I28_006249 [Leishmania naiffi]|uniref:CSD domain-containing protein n=1 Tax=Leishmania naiffi TaxID=5678 RepID=A0AAW3BGE0_9TRYP